MGTAIAAVVVIVLVALAFATRGALKKIGVRPLPDALRPGSTLPAFSAVSETGEPLSSNDLRGKPAVILFVRGNWCPFCSRQVADLTKYYRQIDELGARLILITPKPLETTRRVAEFFEFDFDYWLDPDLAVGNAMGLVQSGGVPDEHKEEYGEDTLWPAAVVVDGDGVVRYASISKLIADRPNPQKFVAALEALQA